MCSVLSNGNVISMPPCDPNPGEVSTANSINLYKTIIACLFRQRPEVFEKLYLYNKLIQHIHMRKNSCE